MNYAEAKAWAAVQAHRENFRKDTNVVAFTHRPHPPDGSPPSSKLSRMIATCTGAALHTSAHINPLHMVDGKGYHTVSGNDAALDDDKMANVLQTAVNWYRHSQQIERDPSVKDTAVASINADLAALQEW